MRTRSHTGHFLRVPRAVLSYVNNVPCIGAAVLLFASVACAQGGLPDFQRLGWNKSGWMLSLGVLLGVTVAIFVSVFFTTKYRKKADEIKYRKEQAEAVFTNAIARFDLTDTEVDKLHELLDAGGFSEPDTIIQSNAVFEKCVDAEVNRLLRMRLPEDRLEEENAIIKNIRKKIGFFRLAPEHPIVSTRTIPIGQPLSLFKDSNRTPLIAHAVIEYNGEFNFAIKYNAASEHPIMLLPGETIKVVFTRPEDGMYGIVVKVAGFSEGTIECAHSMDIRRNQLRKFVRINASVQIRAHLVKPAVMPQAPNAAPPPRNRELLEGKMVDISGGGMSFLCPKSFAAGDLVSLSFSFPEGSFAGVAAKVIRVGVRETKAGETYKHHVQFVNLEPSRQEQIIKYVFEKQRIANQWR